MLDLEVVRQLLLKFRVLEGPNHREYSTLEVIVSILNNSRLQQHISDTLTPDLKNDSKAHLFDLTNRKYAACLVKSDSSSETEGRHMEQPKYSSKQYRLGKFKRRVEGERKSIYGEISSALRVIETILRLNIEGPFDLLNQCHLNMWCLESLTGKGHFYTVPFAIRLDEVEKESKARRSKGAVKSVEHQMTTSINIVHTITSLLNFEHREGISQQNHPSSSCQTKGIIFFSTPLEANAAIGTEVVLMSQLSLLNEWPKRDSITVSVLQILSHSLVLGLEKHTYLSITNRLYPNHKSAASPATVNRTMADLFTNFLSILARNSLR